MAVFRFGLEAVLRQRASAEREAQRGVASLERERLEIERAIRGQQSLIRGEREALTGMLSGGAVDLRGVRSQAAASLHAVAGAQREALRLAGVHEKLRRARAVLLERAVARRAMESLRERRFEEWKRQEGAKEAAALEEIGARIGSGSGRAGPGGEARIGGGG